MRITTISDHLVDIKNDDRRNYYSVRIIVTQGGQEHFFHLRNWQGSGTSYTAKIYTYDSAKVMNSEVDKLLNEKEKRNRRMKTTNEHHVYSDETLTEKFADPDARLDLVMRMLQSQCKLSMVNRKKLYNTISNQLKRSEIGSRVTADTGFDPDFVSDAEPEEKVEKAPKSTSNPNWGMF